MGSEYSRRNGQTQASYCGVHGRWRAWGRAIFGCGVIGLFLVVLLWSDRDAWAATLEVGEGRTFATIQSAVDAASPGDVILIYPGVYRENVVVTQDNLQIRGADPANPPVLDGEDPDFAPGSGDWEHVTSYQTEDGRTPIYRTRHHWPHDQPLGDQFMSYFGGIRLGNTAMQVYEDDHILRGYRSKFDLRYTSPNCRNSFVACIGGPYSDLEQLDPANDPEGDQCGRRCSPLPQVGKPYHIPGRFLYDEASGWLYVWSQDENSPAGHSYHIPVLFHLMVIQDARGVEVSNIVFRHAMGYALRIQGANGISVHHCFFLKNRYDLWDYDADQVSVTDCFFQEKGLWERYWYNDLKATALWGPDLRVETDGDIEIARCSFSEAYTVLGNHGSAAVAFHHNIVARTMSSTISADDAPGGEQWIYENVFHHSDLEPHGLSNKPMGSTSWIYRNIYYRCRFLMRNGGQHEDEAQCSARLYNNTFVLGQSLVSHPYNYPVFKQVVLRNNLVFLRDVSLEMYWIYYGRDPQYGWSFFPFSNGPDSDHNVLWRAPESGWGIIGRFRLTTGSGSRDYEEGEFDAMRNDTGLEMHSIEADPLFAHESDMAGGSSVDFDIDDFSGLDYRDVVSAGYDDLFRSRFCAMYRYFDVLPGSPARDSGIQLPSDWPDSVAITDGLPDVGAVEYGAEEGPAFCQTSQSEPERRTVHARKLSTDQMVTLDGLLSESAWEGADEQRLDSTMVREGSNSGDADLSGRFRAVWTSDELCVGVFVVDDAVLASGNGGGEIWRDDAVELFLDSDDSHGSDYGMDDWHLGCTKDGQTWKWANGSGESVEWMRCATQVETGGWSAEICLRWSGIGLSSPEAGAVLGFDVALDDSDVPGGGERESQEVWNGNGDGYRDPRQFGQLVLDDVDTPPPVRDGGLDAGSNSGTTDGGPSRDGGPSTVSRSSDGCACAAGGEARVSWLLLLGLLLAAAARKRK